LQVALMLETRDLTARFGGHVAVDAISCRFRPGELTVIAGPDGAGKTTYFNLISGQVIPTRGEVMLLGDPITRMSVAARARHGIGRGFQRTALFPNLTVAENIRVAARARARHDGRLPRPADRDAELRGAPEHILGRVHLARMSHRLAADLSRTDQRMLETALLIALDPKVFMFDEPTSGMSEEDAAAVLSQIDKMRHDRSKCVLLIEHRPDVIRDLADRVIVLHDGRLLADGPPEAVMALESVRDAFMGAEFANV
jgi:branched-chain amino acid transport system ATP-binding protein